MLENAIKSLEITNQIGKQSLLPWRWCNRSCLARITTLETSYCNRLKRAARKVHPNLYEFIKITKRTQAATEVTIRKRRQAAGQEKQVCSENIKTLTAEKIEH